MIIFITRDRANQVVELLCRATGEGAIGDARSEVRPGESAFGYTFEEWMAMTAPSITID